MIEVTPKDLYFAKTKPNAIIPTKRDEDAGYDCYCAETETIVIPPCSVRLIDTGIAMACSKDWFPKFFDKGGMGTNGMIVGAGVGDSGYRDSYFVPIINTNKHKYFIMTNQTEEEVEKANWFNLETKRFLIGGIDMVDVHDLRNEMFSGKIILKSKAIVKYLNKAFVQFVMLPVPQLEPKEITWEDLKAIKSERGLGKLGSSGK